MSKPLSIPAPAGTRISDKISASRDFGGVRLDPKKQLDVLESATPKSLGLSEEMGSTLRFVTGIAKSAYRATISTGKALAEELARGSNTPTPAQQSPDRSRGGI